MTARAALRFGLILLTCAAHAVTAANATVDAGAITGEHFGTVSFPVSCAPAVQAQFNRGIALLHDFWYDEARPQFERIVAADPSCAMAHWGLAMSGFHQIWDRPDPASMAAGWHEMQAALGLATRTDREHDYVAALAEFFRPGTADYQTRIDAYAAALHSLYGRHPEDADAGAFYALALLAAEAPNDVSLKQEHAALAVLNPLWQRYPDHPGVVHYIIHACDTPSLARQGLAAAQRYGDLAASGAHAVHMPGHIFARLGMWPEDIRANLASVAASRAAQARHETGWMDQFHSDDFLSYAYLQRGEDAQARAVVQQSAAAIGHYQSMSGMADDAFMTFVLHNFRVKLPVIFALEVRDWHAAAALAPGDGPLETQTIVYWARVIADGHLRQPHAARADLAKYRTLMEQIRHGDLAYMADGTGARIREAEMQGWAAFAEGDVMAAVGQLRAAADLQDRVGQGEVDIPAREMLGDLLLESGQPAAALVEYEASQKLSPNRLNGLYGAGQAAESSGNLPLAGRYYAALLESTAREAHGKRPQLVHAHAFLAGHPRGA